MRIKFLFGIFFPILAMLLSQTPTAAVDEAAVLMSAEGVVGKWQR
jgi:hypothetical protein